MGENYLINKNNGLIIITEKYLKVFDKTSSLKDQNIYEMKINSWTNKYKDISVNGGKI